MTQATGDLLTVENLNVEFDTYGGIVQAVRGVDFSVAAGEILAIVGESGCGKSVTVQSMMGVDSHASGSHYAGFCAPSRPRNSGPVAYRRA